MAKRSSDPWVAYPEIKVQVRFLVRVVVIVDPLPQGINIRCAGYPQQRYTTGEPGKAQGQDRVGIVESSCGYRPAGSVFEENSFYRETRVTRLVGSPCG